MNAHALISSQSTNKPADEERRQQGTKVPSSHSRSSKLGQASSRFLPTSDPLRYQRQIQSSMAPDHASSSSAAHFSAHEGQFLPVTAVASDTAVLPRHPREPRATGLIDSPYINQGVADSKASSNPRPSSGSRMAEQRAP
jgi:hypothetical protein